MIIPYEKLRLQLSLMLSGSNSTLIWSLLCHYKIDDSTQSDCNRTLMMSSLSANNTQATSTSISMGNIISRHRATDASVSDSDTQIDPGLGPIAQTMNDWFKIQLDIPPQLTGRNIQAISVGGVIGTGLFLGISQSLRDGGPAGMIIGYVVTGSIVYAVVVSLAEMVASLPNVGGPVGLADLYVDRALGFAMGWNAWYHWSVVLPAELSAAAVIATFYVSESTENYDYVVKMLHISTITVLLVAAAAINFLGKYGQYESYFAMIKICTIVALLIIGIVIDNLHLKTSTITPPNGTVTSSQNLTCISDTFNPAVDKMNIGFKYLTCPGAFVQYKGIPGLTGKILGIWSVMMQAIFSFIGSEIPGIAGAEVENPRKNIPSAVRRVWIRIFLCYISGVFVAGLLVPYNNTKLWPQDEENGSQYVQSSPFIIAMQTAGLKFLPHLTSAVFLLSAWSAATADVYMSSRFLFFLARRGHAPRFLGTLISTRSTRIPLQSEHNSPNNSPHRPQFVVPVFGIIIAAIFSILAFLPTRSLKAEHAFQWLSSMTSAAAMLSWVSMMVIYIRWHAGIKHAEFVDPDFMQTHPQLYENRARFQPYLAWYAIVMCTSILLLHGWAVFTISEVRRIAIMPGDLLPQSDPILGGTFVLVFVTSYLPIPVFLLCTFGYKLIKQTSLVELHEMDFDGAAISPHPDEHPQTTFIEKLRNTII